MNCDPSAATGVLDNVLTDFGEGHREAHRRARLEVKSSSQHRLRFRLNSVHDLMNVFCFCYRRDLEQDAKVLGASSPWHSAADLVEVLGIAEKLGAAPIACGVLELGHSKRRTLKPGLRDGEERGQPVRRRPPGSPGIDENFFVGGKRCQRFEYLLEACVVQ